MKTFSWYKHPSHWSESRKWVSASIYTKLPIEKILTLAISLYEYANEQRPRGSVLGFDPSLYDYVFRWKKGTALRIVEQFRAQGIILDDDRLEDWPDETQEEGLSDKKTSTSRVREYRERQKKDETPVKRNETPDETPVKRNETPDETHIRYKNKNLEKDKYTPLTPQGETQGVGVSTPAQTSSPLKARETPRPDQDPELAPKPTPETPAADTPQAPDTTTAPATPPQADLSHGNPAWKEFCYVFSLWPVQQGKEKAWREYAALKARHLVPESYALADIIERFKAEDRRWKRGYVPMMANWLRDRRWDDVPEKAPAKSYAPDENGSTPYVDEHDQDYTSSGFGSIFDSLKEKANA